MDPDLELSLAPVLRDLERSRLHAPRFGEDDWLGDPAYASSMMWSADGSGCGLSVPRDAPEADRVAQVADAVQEWVIEDQLWGSAPTNWPACPYHPATHPLRAAVVDRSAVWACPLDDRVVAPIGG